ncbi:MAG: toxins and related Ca2+-binding domain, partial [Actinomycetota bacterium]
MRSKISLLLAAVLGTLLSPISPQAVAVSTVPSAPQDIVVTAVEGGLSITWSAPADISSGILAYRIEYSNSGASGTWLALLTSTTDTSYTYLGFTASQRYIRVQARSSGGYGTYGYPWTKIYGTTSLNRNSLGNITYESGFGLGGSDASTTYSGANFSRVKYRLDTTVSGTSYYAETDFYEWVRGNTANATSNSSWDPTVDSIRIPSTTTNQQYTVQANVSDLNVYSTSPRVTNSNGPTGLRGRLEIWPWNYAMTLSTLTDPTWAGDGATYDFNDSPNADGGYGSFQVHDMSNGKPVFVWNNIGYGYNAEVGYGTASSGNPDYTFCNGGAVCPTPNYFRLQIYINRPTTPLADTNAPTVTRVDTKTVVKSTDTLTVRSSEKGYIYLIKSTVNVLNYSFLQTALAAEASSVSVQANTETTLTINLLEDGLYKLYALDPFNNMSAPILGTVQIDSNGPAFISASVSASGTAITMTVSETLTYTSLDPAIFVISDGSSLSVTSANLSGPVATLNLNRAIPGGLTVTFRYAPTLGASTGRFVDAYGNLMPEVTSRSITNSSTQAISVTLAVPSTIYKGGTSSMSISVPLTGKVTFMLAGKRIPGCINKIATGSTPIAVTCTFKASLGGSQNFTALFTPTNQSVLPAISIPVNRYIVKRSTT